MLNERNSEFLTFLAEIADKFSSFNEEKIFVTIPLRPERFLAIRKSVDIENFEGNTFHVEIDNVKFSFHEHKAPI